ncbi:FtsW/RodA/SpoVE family cell cycle protein [Isobaculum melis]|uniref:Rod shape determining protein RodA n=1 Tax=Isobaculum melis TaxID=142588 RepID=A0A1H9Q0Q1_9LACT|nr:FtsW/RodA/SpoVE family cell cycle protein [Isobaculum melis]SER53645.1 rod shape determining protein RodA [Isobaculum melis]
MSSNESSQDSKIDYGIILSLIMLCIVSLTSIYAAAPSNKLRLTLMQLAFYIVGAIAIIVIMQFDSEQLWKIAPYAYLLGIILLILVLIFYDRATYAASGGKSWFRFGSVSFQPSEVMKSALILMLARVITKHNSQNRMRNVKSDFILLAKMAGVMFVPMLLIQLQGDLGTVLVFLAIAIGMVLMSGITWKILVPAFGSVAGVLGTAFYFVLYNRNFLIKLGFKNYQFDRIDSWLRPYSDTSSKGYQLVQSMKAIGSGKISGKHYMVSEVHVPERHTDFIFSSIGESFGFIGGCVVLFLFFLLIYQLIRVCFDSKNEFYAYICTGVIMMVLFHVLENVGMTIGLLPITGIPLPFVSYGGSSLLGNMIAIGMVMSMRYHHKSYMFSEQERDFKRK